MARSRAPFVAVRTDIRKEERVRFIADFAGYNEDEAIGKLIRMWSWCTDRGLEDAPADCEGYAVPDAVVRRFLGSLGVPAILGDGCDELAMGERRPDGLIYLRGTAETVSRIRSLRASASAGGRARAASGWRTAGRFVGTATDDQPPAVQLAAGETSAGSQSLQLATSRTPAATSVIPDPRSQIPDQKDPPPARAIPPSTEHGRPDAAARSAVRAQVRTQLEAARARAGAARKVPVQPLLAFDRGLDVDLTEQLSRAATGEALDRLAGQARHAIAMAELEVAHGGKSFEWFTGAIFSGGNFPRLVGMTPEDAKRTRLPAKGSPSTPPPAPRRPDPGPAPVMSSLTPEERIAAAAEERARLQALLADDNNPDENGDDDAS